MIYFVNHYSPTYFFTQIQKSFLPPGMKLRVYQKYATYWVKIRTITSGGVNLPSVRLSPNKNLHMMSVIMDTIQPR